MAGTTSRFDDLLAIRLADGQTWVHPVAFLNAAGVIVTPIQNPNGQATSANSQPVVIASDQSPVAIKVGVGATDLGKAEDSASVSGDTGVFMLGIRNDSVVSLTDANLDYTGFSATQYGAIHAAAGLAQTSADGTASSIGVRLTRPGGSLLGGQLEIRPALLNAAGSYDMQRLNGGLTLLASAARTTATDSADFTNYNWRGAIFVIDITAGTTPSLTFTVQGKDPVSGKYFTQLQTAALAAVATTVIYVYPGSTPANNVTANAPLATTFRMDVAVGNANSITYSVGCIPIL